MSEKFVPQKPLETAVLFLVFNRLDVTKQVFAAIKKAKPPRLYIAADGARDSVIGENEKAQEVRDCIMSNIDWDCEVKTLFRDKNLGCKYAVSGAIDWFFNQEEMGIILEDDCLPSQSFFWFCEELLIKYKDDMRIGQVSGFNSLDMYDFGFDYHFSKYGPIWGWASWKRAWNVYDVEMKNWPYFKEKKLYESFFNSMSEKFVRTQLFDQLFQKKIDTWDYQWTYAKLSNSMLSIIPSKNLILNIGFNEDATHTKKISNNIKDLTKKELTIKRHYPFIINNVQYKRLYYNKFMKNRTLLVYSVFCKFKELFNK